MIDPAKNDPERVAKLAARNARVIEDFRANGGVTERYGRAVIIMHTIGAKTGLERLIPVVAFREPAEDGSSAGDWVVLAAVQGAPNNPDWYYNLLAHPEIEVEYPGESGVETVRVKVTDTPADEWQAAFDAVCERNPGFREMQEKTSRRIPILRLHPLEAAQ